MARPSMTALLAVLAMAGYQNRDKLAEMLGGAMGGGRAAGPAGEGGRMGGQMGGQVGGQMGGQMPATPASAGGIGDQITSGLRDLVDRFRQAGHGDTADSWVAHGPNRPVEPQNLEQALGHDTLDEIAQHTGLSRQEIVARLSRNLPDAVDRYTPDGRLPNA